MKLLLVLSALAIASCTKEPRSSCDTFYCVDGQECVERRYGEPVCECISECKEPKAPVCGSNGKDLKTFESECDLLKYSCEMKDIETMIKVADTSCEEDFMEKKEKSESLEKDESREKPVVCPRKERDNLRSAIMAWLKSNLNVEEDHRSYKGLLFTYFNKYDENKDGSLDTMEFIKIMEEDDTIAKVLPSSVSTNPMIQGLCMSELLAITDEDSDYKLTFDEFHKCFDPAFVPPHQQCTLEGRMYNDGEEIEQSCNTCKCACGNWVCTHNPCDGEENSSKAKFLRDDQM